MTRRFGLAAALVFTTLAGVAWWGTGSGGPGDLATTNAPSDVRRIASGTALSLSRSEVPATGLVVELELPVAPSPGAASLPGRVIDEDRRTVEIVARIDPALPGWVRVEIPPGFLSAGRYVIEVETTERTHLPLRRYVLEID